MHTFYVISLYQKLNLMKTNKADLGRRAKNEKMIIALRMLRKKESQSLSHALDFVRDCAKKCVSNDYSFVFVICVDR